MADDPRDVFSFTDEQRLELIVNLIIDKIEEEREQGWPSIKHVEIENSKPSKYPPDIQRKINTWIELISDKYGDKGAAEKFNKPKHIKKSPPRLQQS
jgi:hypothetical protein